MTIYLVGGAVRDQLMGLAVRERDWVVTGSTPETMLKQGYRPVGKEFPVFLHPETREEYALARTERKISKGYQGFTFYTDPEVRLEDDLARRDLTINAIAQDENGKLIDPYHGQRDLQDKIFRHVSPAFAEDPVRILRLARFACRFPDFSIHPSTLALMKDMVIDGEVDALVSERVWQELHRALDYEKPTRFFTVLNDCGALEKLFPEISIKGKGFKLLASMTSNVSALQRFAILTHDLSLDALKRLNQRYRLPKDYMELATLLIRFGKVTAELNVRDGEAILNLLERSDAIRREQRFIDFLTASTLCFAHPHQTFLKSCLQKIQSIDTRKLQEKGLKGKAFGDAVRKLRLINMSLMKE